MRHCYCNDNIFLEPLYDNVPGAVELYRNGTTFPVLIMNINEHRHAACLPGFISHTDPENISKQIELIKSTSNILTAFLQYRGAEISQIKEMLTLNNIKHYITENNLVNINLDRDHEYLLQQCGRSTRLRLRKIISQNNTYNTTYNDSFYTLYNIIARHNDFSMCYMYSESDIKKMSTSNNIHSVSVYNDRNDYVGGSIIGHYDDDTCDYILSSYDKNINNSGRLILWYSIIAAKKLGYKKINLGGGITGDDSLMHFKMSFGGKKQPFYTIKIIFDEQQYRTKYNITSDTCIDMSQRFPPKL